MPVTSTYPEFGNRFLTSIGREAHEGDEVTLSCGSFMGREFTTYRLGPVVGTNSSGEALFDMEADTQEIKINDWGQPETFATRGEINAVIKDNWRDREVEIKGLRFRRTGFGHWVPIREEK